MLDDITLVLCIDEHHLDELNFAWDTWMYYKPEITNIKNKLLIYDTKISHKIHNLKFVNRDTILHPFNNHHYYNNQRDAMLTSWFEGFSKVNTPYYLKIDTDCFATNDDKTWIKNIEDRYRYVFISSRWGYTKNPKRIFDLEDWADKQDLFKNTSRLNLLPVNNTIVSPRIISFFFIGNTAWTNKMSGLCWKNDHYDLPAPSHDTFLWYCAKRGSYDYKTVKFADHGFSHTKLSKARKQIKLDNSDQKSIIENNNLHIGCGRKKYEGWLNTDKNELDITNITSWHNNHIKENSVQKILAEHVFEHLSKKDRELAVFNFHRFLTKNGFVRIAVPDGYHPDKNYIENVKPQGKGASADDHKFLYNYQSLCDVFLKYKFFPRYLEFFDQFGNFHYNEWDIKDGFIKRSSKFDRRNRKKPLSYTSLIIDFIKK